MDYGCPTVVPESPAPYHIFISAISIIVFTYIQVKRIMTKEGASLRASMYATVQVINAGDGGHNHPTQTLIDFMDDPPEKRPSGSSTAQAGCALYDKSPEGTFL